MWRLILFLVAILTPSWSANADQMSTDFTIGTWVGSRYYDDSGQFRYCVLQNTYNNGILITFALFPDGHWNLGFNRTGGFSADVKRRIDMYVDGRFVFGSPANPAGRDLVISLPSTTELFQALRAGRSLQVVTPGGQAQFDLTGSAAALVRLLGCVQKQSAPAIATSVNPQEPTQFSRDQILTYAANVLAEANVTGYRFLPFEHTKELGDVAWILPDGTLGALMLVRAGQAAVDLGDIVTTYSQGQAKGCKGDFVGGKKAPRWVGAVEIYKTFSICKAGADSYRFEHSFLRLPNGIYARHVTGRVGEAALSVDDTAAIQRSEDALLRVSLPN